MAKSTVKRKLFIKSYAGLGAGAAKYTIKPLTKKAYEYTTEFLRRRVGRKTGNLEKAITWDVWGTTGAVKAETKFGETAGQHAHLIEYGTGPRQHDSGKSTGSGPARPFMRPGVAKAMRELRSFYKQGFQEALDEQRT